ncbi:hypothetical protein SCHPADRAFT_998716 [Schizopora paradoxa]|uniref:Uncharacterized protein n=1 Tax=Schizopora paradoxa TaxID=27342 RepID=A0A0H2RIL7_9AGAM|nr:hypothetical protein SCHPADRAFT_998716 [Schizopora paradoxa]
MHPAMTATDAVSTPSPPSEKLQLPDEILFNVLEFAANQHLDLSQKEPSIDVGNCSAWSKDLRFKKGLLRVCKRWRIIAAPILYDRIFLHRIGQLVVLVKALEDGGRGPLVHHIHGRLLVLPPWENVYVKYIIRLLELCDSARTFSWVSILGHRKIDPISARCSTVNFMLHASPSIHSALKSLRKLTISLNRPLQQDANEQSHVSDDTSKLTFDNLEELTCEASDPAHVEGLSLVSSSFNTPQLKKLTIRAPPDKSYLRISDPKFVFEVLGSHGAKLTSLKLDLFSRNESRCISSLLNLTPLLQEFEITSFAFKAFNPESIVVGPFPHLQKLILLVSNLDTAAIDFVLERDNLLTDYFTMAESRRVFPSLHTIRLLDRTLPGAPLDSTIPPSSHNEIYSYLSSRAERLDERGITLLNVDGNVIGPWGPKRARYAGRYYEGLEDKHSDPAEDLTYAIDDEAYHSGSSEYSSWDSELEDGGSDSEDGDPEICSDVGSDDMVEMFKNAIIDSSGDEADDEAEVE